MSVLTFENVSFTYENRQPILTDINLSLERGEFRCLVGRSGCGKTTLLKLAAGLLLAEEGEVVLNGRKVTAPTEDTGFVFQSPTLLKWKTVTQNVLLPISLTRKVTEQDREKAYQLLEMMDITEHADRFPNRLSGGQQSRVSIARALITNPSLLFMDEPFAALDALTREELQDDLLQICKRQKTTVLFITHDIQEAVYLADIVTVMEKGRLTHSTAIQLNREAAGLLRYSQQYNERCLDVRRHLEASKV